MCLHWVIFQISRLPINSRWCYFEHLVGSHDFSLIGSSTLCIFDLTCSSAKPFQKALHVLPYTNLQINTFLSIFLMLSLFPHFSQKCKNVSIIIFVVGLSSKDRFQHLLEVNFFFRVVNTFKVNLWKNEELLLQPGQCWLNPLQRLHAFFKVTAIEVALSQLKLRRVALQQNLLFLSESNSWTCKLSLWPILSVCATRFVEA